MLLVFFLSSLLTDSLYIPGKEQFHSFPMSKPDQRAFADTSSKLSLSLYIYILYIYKYKMSFLVVNPVALVFSNNISLKCKYCHQSFLLGKKKN